MISLQRREGHFSGVVHNEALGKGIGNEERGSDCTKRRQSAELSRLKNTSPLTSMWKMIFAKSCGSLQKADGRSLQ